MDIALVHNQVCRAAAADDRDVLAQVGAVSDALARLGHAAVTLDATLDLKALQRRLLEVRPNVVFNLVESLAGADWLMFAAPGLFDALGLPYTGAPTEAILLANHKLLAKEWLRQAGLPTPDWLPSWADRRGREPEHLQGGTFRPGTWYILKTVTEHASCGLGDGSVVVPEDDLALRRHVAEHADALGHACFAEQYVDGREFNLALLASVDGPKVLPPAEIDFTTFPPGKPRIVGYDAKWEVGSFEYDNTPRRFDFPIADRALLGALRGLALACWDLFGLRGYGRVDFRVDAEGQPWILEVNANPCLAPEAGYVAALARASIPFERAIQRILDHAVVRAGRCGRARSDPATSAHRAASVISRQH